MIKDDLKEAYRLLFNCFKEQRWWPGETPFEIAVGAILTQNTSWQNVEKAIFNLKSKVDFSPNGLYKLSSENLSELIKPPVTSG
jgi:endonuclease-3 related protein